ncbi:zinc-dependent metalloprotease family protein [Pseudosulfitobacter koreensis]|uniref:M12 family metallopeptidase n=1 Tax=Pseudosulfitobacter koreensis TaxID=2968472 RepID=A0ABT1Z1G9_9RHOB|nr:M12 family metallopeptidase [Pseudosulfitobacter koreense]MCR8826963.1 M12 family metallopeptidase [Pseudosulfitobacter koreense]
MNRFHLRIIAAALLILPAPVLACSFTQVIAGVCQTGETRRAASATGADDKGVLRRTELWTFFKEFREESDVRLRVCGFVAPPADSNIDTIDFRAAPAQFRDNMAIIENAAQEWVVNSPENNTQSRLVFQLRDGAGAFHECTSNARDYHIKITFNSKGTNNSYIGSNSATKNPSMNLSVGTNRRVQRSTVLHEFGHALGLGHEMMHRHREACMQQFDAELWLEDFLSKSGGRMPFGNDIPRDEQIRIARKNIQVVVINLGGIELTTFKDDASIMSYPISAESFSSNGKNCEMRNNSRLSAADRGLSLTNYGKFAP